MSGWIKNWTAWVLAGSCSFRSDENVDSIEPISQDGTSVTIREVTSQVLVPASLRLMIIGLATPVTKPLASKAKTRMQRKGLVAAKLLGTMLLILFGARTGVAAPGYTYDLLFSGVASSQTTSERLCPAGVAINNRGDVAFRTGAGFSYSTSERIRVYLAARGQLPVVIYDELATKGENDPGPNAQLCSGVAPLGINDNGIVAIPIRWPDPAAPVQTLDFGYALLDPDVGVIRTLRGMRYTAGRVNTNLQMGGGTSFGRSLIVMDGVTTTDTTIAGVTTDSIYGLANINNSGVTVGAGRFAVGDTFKTTIFRNAPSQPPAAIPLGNQAGASPNAYTDAFTPGINDAGWVSFSTNANNNAVNDNPQILLISPTGAVNIVADTSGDFANFWQPRNYATKGTSINNFNRVSFVAQTDDNPSAGQGKIYIGDASGYPARMVYGNLLVLSNGGSFGDGNNISYGNDVTDHGTNSLNDRGEIAVGAYGNLYDPSGTLIGGGGLISVIVARPQPGMEPGFPIIPGAEDALPGGGWRIRGARAVCAETPDVPADLCATWVDPPLAVGYSFAIEEGYAGSFASVSVPIPLPGGDADFTVVANGKTAPLQAGTVLKFESMTTNPVRSFRISDIAQTETLDPNDATAFVTGLTFSEDTPADMVMTMVPIVVDTDGTNFTLKSSTVAGCKSVVGTVTLSNPAPDGGVLVTLSDTLTAATAPATVTVPAGALSKNFTVKTVPVEIAESGTVTATVGNQILSQDLTVKPMGMKSVTLTPSKVVGGNQVVGKANLECKAGPGPILVDLSSSNAEVASPLGANIAVPQGLQSVKFDVNTNAVQVTSYATISGTANGVTKSKKLTVSVAAAVTPTSLKFSSVAIGATSVLNVTLTNKGTEAFAVGSINPTGTNAKYYSQINNCPANLSAGASCTIGVSFSPTVAGSKSAKLSVATSATSVPLSVSLSGTGI